MLQSAVTDCYLQTDVNCKSIILKTKREREGEKRRENCVLQPVCVKLPNYMTISMVTLCNFYCSLIRNCVQGGRGLQQAWSTQLDGQIRCNNKPKKNNLFWTQETDIRYLLSCWSFLQKALTLSEITKYWFVRNKLRTFITKRWPWFSSQLLGILTAWCSLQVLIVLSENVSKLTTFRAILAGQLFPFSGSTDRERKLIKEIRPSPRNSIFTLDYLHSSDEPAAMYLH